MHLFHSFFISFSFLEYVVLMIFFSLYIQDEILRRAVQRFKGKNWKKIGTIVELCVHLH